MMSKLPADIDPQAQFLAQPSPYQHHSETPHTVIKNSVFPRLYLVWSAVCLLGLIINDDITVLTLIITVYLSVAVATCMTVLWVTVMDHVFKDHSWW